jgi:hypothetical protein
MRWTAVAGACLLLACGVAAWSQPPAPVAEEVTPPARRLTAAHLANAADVRQRFGLTPEYENVPGVERLKIAVLDYGFAGMETGRPYLPEGTVLVEHYDPDFVRRFKLGDPDYKKPLDPANHHGRSVAQIVWAVTGSHPEGPRFYLLNANGPTMLRRAVRYAIEQKVDVVLFSGSFEGGGNGDGRGPINRVVADALAAGILWVNAAGNYGHHIYTGPVRIGTDGYLRFRDGTDGSALRFRNRLDENTVTVTLTWNDYRDTEDAGTDKDLDLIVEDPSGKVVGSSEKKQVTGKQEAGPGESRNPRERVVLADLPRNVDLNYRIRVRAKSSNFTWDDRIRVLVTSGHEAYTDSVTGTVEDAVPFFDASGRDELYPPADNPLVLTVGDVGTASSVGPTADNRLKPDLVLEDSRAFFSDGELLAGSSNAAAYFAGIVAVLKAAEPGLATRHLLRLAQQAPLSTATLSTAPRTMRFYPPAAPAPAPVPIRSMVLSRYGRRVVLPMPRLEPVVADQAASRSEVPPLLRNRVWRTPSRARLAEVVRTDR